MNSKKLDFFKAKISTQALVKALTDLYGERSSIRLEWSSYYKAIDGEYDTQLSGIHKSGISETGINYQVNLWESFDYDQEQANQITLGNQFAISKSMLPYTGVELPFMHVSVKEMDLCIETGWPNDNAEIWLLYGTE